jgi:hypothetical protein
MVYLKTLGGGVAQSVQRWATGWTAQVEFPEMQNLFSPQRPGRLQWGRAALSLV